MAFWAPVRRRASSVPLSVLLFLSVLLLLELRDGVHLRPGLHLAHLGRVVALHHQHVGHLAVFLRHQNKDFCLQSCCSGPQLQLELYLRDKDQHAADLGHDLSA